MELKEITILLLISFSYSCKKETISPDQNSNTDTTSTTAQIPKGRVNFYVQYKEVPTQTIGYVCPSATIMIFKEYDECKNLTPIFKSVICDTKGKIGIDLEKKLSYYYVRATGKVLIDNLGNTSLRTSGLAEIVGIKPDPDEAISTTISIVK